jgi:hypothetical protein
VIEAFSVSPFTDDAMAESFQLVDTSSFDLKVYVAFHFSQLPDIQLNQEIRPAHVMLETTSRSWVPLCCDKEEARFRGHWGHEEEMLNNDCPRSDIVVLEINFTAYGAAYFLMNKTLTTNEESRYRFHGNIPFRSVSRDGQFLFEVGGIRNQLQVDCIDGARLARYATY